MSPSPIQFPPFLDPLNDQETLLAFLATIVLVLVTGIYLSWTPSISASSERTIILVGPPGAGKTAVFSQLTHLTHPPTHASLVPSSSHLLLPPPSHLSAATNNKVGPPPRKYKIIDYPGHPRLAQGLKELVIKEIVRGGGTVGGTNGGVAVVFVVDGSGREKDVGGVVDILLPLLPLTAPPSPLPLLLLTTKQDLLPPQTRSLAIPRLHTALTRELNARRSAASQSSAGKIELLDDDANAKNGGGTALDEGVDEILRGGGKWRWEDWKGVGWAGGWVGDGKKEGKEKKGSAWTATEDEEAVQEEKKKKAAEVEEDGLGELKEWMWNLK